MEGRFLGVIILEVSSLLAGFVLLLFPVGVCREGS